MEKPNYTEDYNFKRLSKKGENSWDDILNRFIKAMLDRGCRTTKKDMEWLLLNYYAIPNSPALLTAGNEKLYASACSSYPVSDSMSDETFSILNSFNISIKATKAGIGTGFNYSKLRSKEEPVNGRKGTTGGPVSFLRGMDGFTREITQATRKSASMGTLSVHHPDIIEFCNCKKEDGNISSFNISVLVTDEFMEAVINDREYEVRYPHTKEIKMIKAKPIFDLIAQNTWDNGEPGIIYTGNIEKDYFQKVDGEDILQNPCQEAILHYSDEKDSEWLEMCVLGSLNLPKYYELDLDGRTKAIRILTSILNDIIDFQDYVTPLQKRGMQEINRKIGIGVCGLATLLAKKDFKYSSEKAYQLTRNIFKEIGTLSLEASENSYEHYKLVIDPNSPLHDLKRANASLISIAPTSSISNIMSDINEEGCSYGCEPYFSIDPYTINNSYGQFQRQEKIVAYLDNKTEHIETANNLHWKSHIKIVEAIMDANWKLGISQSVSKTVNFETNVAIDEVKEAMIYCWQNKIKGISFYRNNSRDNQVIQTSEKSITLDTKQRPLNITYLKSPKRPEMLCCDIHHITANRQKWIVLVGKFKNKPYEIFAGLEEDVDIPKKHKLGIIEKQKNKYNLVIGETEDDTLRLRNIPRLFLNDEFATSTRLISMALRHGTPLPFLVDQLQKEGTINSINKAISRVLKKYIEDQDESGVTCPECKSKMKYISGCLACSCGFTKCS